MSETKTMRFYGHFKKVQLSLSATLFYFPRYVLNDRRVLSIAAFGFLL